MGAFISVTHTQGTAWKYYHGSTVGSLQVYNHGRCYTVVRFELWSKCLFTFFEQLSVLGGQVYGDQAFVCGLVEIMV